jgi:hypothetical protein
LLKFDPYSVKPVPSISTLCMSCLFGMMIIVKKGNSENPINDRTLIKEFDETPINKVIIQKNQQKNV